MGNFSFGDYFKPGAVEMAYELVDGRVRPRPGAHLGDGLRGRRRSSAPTTWRATSGSARASPPAASSRSARTTSGRPARPARAARARSSTTTAGRSTAVAARIASPGCDCDRFLEFWNLVFMEFDRGDDGSLTPLPTQNIDTGSGLERVAMLLQDARSIYETDETTHVIQAIERLSGKRYADGGDAVRSFRVLCDHGRGMSAVATDGVIPSNEGRGYVLRRMIRRAVLHGTRLGLETPFLGAVHEAVIESLADGYPELAAHRDDVRRLLEAEEERFSQTLATGSRLLDDLIARARDQGESNLHAGDVFELHDTHGFPVEMTAELAREAGLRHRPRGLRGAHAGPARARPRRRSPRRSSATTSASRASLARRRAASSWVRPDRRRDRGAGGRARRRRAHARQARALAVLPRGRRPGVGQRRDLGARRARADRVGVPPRRGPGAARAPRRRSARRRPRARPCRRGAPPRDDGEPHGHAPAAARAAQPARRARPPGGVGGAPRGSALRLHAPAPLSAEELRAVEDEVNRVVLEDHPVEIFETSQDEAASSARRCCSARSTATSSASWTSRAIRRSCAAARTCARPPPSARSRSCASRRSARACGASRRSRAGSARRAAACRPVVKEAAAALRSPPTSCPRPLPRSASACASSRRRRRPAGAPTAARPISPR